MARLKKNQKTSRSQLKGTAKNYITRNQALKKLQCTLSDFRRLTILKGIYPRAPRSIKKANQDGSSAPASYYYYKDIQYLLHEPVLQKLREHKAFAKKLSKALGRGELGLAKNLEESRPKYRLDHIIKERYPTFNDSLRDLDDALSLIILFAHLPSSPKVPSSIIAHCNRLAAEWQLYVMKTKSLRKVFLSIKGIYFQAEVGGETITWLVPYMFTQNVPSDIDFRIMMTFLELYQTLLGFVFFKLYTDANLVYPPRLDLEKDEAGATSIGSLVLEEKSRNLTVEGVKGTEEGLKAGKKGAEGGVSVKEVRKQIKEIGEQAAAAGGEEVDKADVGETSAGNATTTALEDEDRLDDFASIAASASASAQPLPTSNPDDEDSATPVDRLFKSYAFYLSREVTRPVLEFCIKAFSGQVGWDPILGPDSPFTETDPRITHHVVDRPSLPASTATYGGKRTFIQPQWIVDCINLKRILPTEEYGPGKVLPPHLSPFVDEEEIKTMGGYVPEEAGGEEVAVDEDEVEEGDEDAEVVEEVEAEEGEEGDAEDVPEPPPKTAAPAKSASKSKAKKASQSEPAISVATPRPALLAAAKNPTDTSLLHAAELEAETEGIPYPTFKAELDAEKKKSLKAKGKGKRTMEEEDGEDIGAAGKRKAGSVSKGEGEQENELANIMLTGKKRKLYEKMKYSKERRLEEKERLETKKKAIKKAEATQKKGRVA